MKKSHANVNLLSLPPEIRNRIILLVLTVQGDGVTIGPNGKSVLHVTASFDHPSKQPALTRVCKQLRAEGLPVFHGNNTFLMRVFHRQATASKPDDATSALLERSRDWLRAIGGNNRALIKSVIFRDAIDGRSYTACGERMAAALKSAGLGLNCSVVQALTTVRNREKKEGEWKEITSAEETSAMRSANIEWVF